MERVTMTIKLLQWSIQVTAKGCRKVLTPDTMIQVLTR